MADVDYETPAPIAKRRRPASPVEGFALLVALIAFVPAFKAVVFDTLDPDSFIHMLAGEQMWREGVGPIVDRQSYMSEKEPWTPYSWLGEFAMVGIWNVAGFRGALLTHALFATALIGLYALAAAARVRGQDGSDGRRLARVAVATAFAAFLSIPYLSFRPVTMALVVMAAIVWLLMRDRAAGEGTRAVWLVVPLTALLINLHLYAIIVPGWIAALWAGALWEGIRSPLEHRAEMRRRLLRYTLLGAATGLACLATPMLPGVIKSIAFYQAADVMVAGSQVKEYLPFYAGTAGKISAALVVMILACAAWRRRELRAGEFLWLLVSVVLLMRMGRFAPVFAMAAAPIFAAAMPRVGDRVLARMPVRLAIAAVLGLAIFRTVEHFPGPSVTIDRWLDRDRDLPGYPTRAAMYVEQNVTRRTGRLINEYTWGGYLSWRLGPRGYQVLLDGRTNLFSPAFWRAAYLSGPQETASFLAAIDADAAILPNGSTRYEPALRGQGWETVYLDGRAMVMVPPKRHDGSSLDGTGGHPIVVPSAAD